MNCLIQYTSIEANGCIPSPVDKTSTEWWYDRGSREISEMAHAGITDILTLPVTRGQGLGNGYDPQQEYNLSARGGNKEQLQRMAAIAKRNGMGFHIDAVLAHMDGVDKDGGIHIKLPNGNYLRFPKSVDCFVGKGIPKDHVLKPSEDFAYLFGKQLSYFSGNYTDADDKDNYKGKGYVLNGRLHWLLRWLLPLLDLQGFRIDNTKSIDPWIIKLALDIAPFWSAGEAWTSDIGLMNYWCFQSGINGRGSLFDFPRFFEIRNMCNNTANYDMTTLTRTGFALTAPMNAVTFVNSHDVAASGNRILNNILLGYALILTSEGLPCIYYPDWNDYGSANKSKLKNLLWIRTMLANGPTIWRDADFNTVVYERPQGNGKSLLIGLNNDSWGDTKYREVSNSMGPYFRWHDYTGHGPDIANDAYSRCRIPLPKNDNGLGYCAYGPFWQDGVIVVHGGSTIQRFEGASDLFEGPAVGGEAVTVGTILCDKNTKISLYPGAAAKGLTFEVLNTNSLPMDLDDDLVARVALRGEYTITVTAPITVKTQDYSISVRYTAPEVLLDSDIAPTSKIAATHEKEFQQ